MSASNEDILYDGISNVDIDFCVGSTENVSCFLDTLQNEWRIGNSGQISYIHALIDLIDFRKLTGVSSAILHNFAVVEIFLKRARRCISKKMRMNFSMEIDIETLEQKGHWATMKELQHVIPFHLPRYKRILELCKKNSVNCSEDLTFATRFIATFLFLRVKGTRPMTYQYLTTGMVNQGKKNKGYIDQKLFKTADKYVFDSVVLDKVWISMLDGYMKYIRPFLHPDCDYLLVNRNGKQLSKLTDCFSILVFEAIGKYVNPTRYRQVIETESCENLELEECTWIPEDQRHSSQVAKMHYRKKRSREVALKGQSCLKKLHGEEGFKVEQSLKSFIEEDLSDSAASNSDSDEVSNNDSVNFTSSNTHIDMSEDVPIYLDRGQKSSSDSNDEKAEKKRKFFTEEEDEALRRGLQRYGKGKWTRILKDSEFSALQGRTIDSLKKRASSKRFLSKFSTTVK